MGKIPGYITKAGAPIVACFAATLLAGAARAADKAQFSGHWSFNPTQSDDAAQKVQEAEQNSKSRGVNPDGSPSGGGYPGGGGNYPGGGYPGGGEYPVGGIGRVGVGGPGGGIWGPSGRNRGGMGNGSGAISSEDWDRLSANPKYLHIDQRSNEFVITDDSDHAQNFYPDGKKHDDKDADGRKISTKATWESGAFVAETKLPHSQKLTQTFRMSDDGKQLYVTSQFDAPSLRGPLSIRRVYDLEKAAAK